MSTRWIESGSIGGARAGGLTPVYWLAWVCACAYGWRWPHQTVLSLWWLVLAVLWLTANLVRPVEELREPSRRWTRLLVVAVGALLLYWSALWFLRLVSGIQLGGVEAWKLTSFALQGLLVACLTALAVVPPLQHALGRVAPGNLWLASAFAAVPLFGGWLLTLEPWAEHGNGILVTGFELLALLLIPPGFAALRERTRNPRRVRSHVLARLWRGELPARAVSLGVYPLTVGIMVLVFRSEFWKLPDDIPRWHQSYYSAVVWIAAWVLILTGTLITLRTLNRARMRRPWGAVAGQLGVVLVSGYFLLVTLHFYAVTAGSVFLESTAAYFGQPYRFDVSGDGKELNFSGGIHPGLTDALAESLAKHPSVRWIRLESGGGLLSEAEDAARLIHAHHLDTLVSAGCVSACTVMFVAGIHRHLDPTGRLGFHAVQSVDPDADSYYEQSLAYAPYGVDDGFVRHVAQVPSGSMWYPMRDELVRAHVVGAGW